MTAIKDGISIGKHIIKNRIAFAPTVKFGWSDRTGEAGDCFARHYEARAASGTGLIVVEATCISPEGRLSPDQLGLWEDGQTGGHEEITKACHRHGAVVLVQIHHGGLGQHPECGRMVAPSARVKDGREAHPLTVEEIHAIRRQFIEAAARAQKAGYDGVQLHACHGYLLNNFASPLFNHRMDCYGGNTENRTRLGCEIIEGIRSVCGKDFIVSVRTGGAEPSLEEGCAIADRYIAAGADLLQVSHGMEWAYSRPEELPYSEICCMGIEIRRHVNGRVPVSVVNGIMTPEQARGLISAGLADIVDSARALLADPDWSAAVLEGTDYVPCRLCKRCLWGPGKTHRCPALAERRRKNPDCIE
jgi:2,4-dienoyl-CoA reductase-like NADH-dependent reductase (Old Yellow Enzyme family)